MEKKGNGPTLKKELHFFFVMILWEHQRISEESEHMLLRRRMQYTHIIRWTQRLHHGNAVLCHDSNVYIQ